MAGFEDREKAQEAKFARDETLRFRAEARRNKLLGLWAAEQMDHADPQAYAREVVAADFKEAGDDDVLRKVADDFANSATKVTDAEIRAKMTQLMEVARQQILSES